MFKKFIFSLAFIAILTVSALGQPSIGTTYHEIQIVDEMGAKVTEITSVSIYNPGTTTESTIYAGRLGALAMTNPVLTDSGSTNSTLASGYMSWWGPGNYDFSMTDGNNVHTNSGHRDRTASEGSIAFPSYLTSISSTTYDDNETITLGTSADWVINAGTTADLMTFTPATDGAVFRVGLANGNKSADLQWYTASGVGLLISESSNTFGITGLTANINVSSNYNTNLCTGTSTGATTIGNSAGGIWAIDGAASGTINADDSIAMTVSAGTIGIASTGGDITIDGTDSSVIIRGTEAVGDAIYIHADDAAGGIDITSGTGDIVLTSTDDIVLTNATAAGDMIQLLNTAGTSVTEDSAAIQMTATAGGIQIQSDAAIDGDVIILRADGGVTNDILIHNDQGTGADCINLLADAGGITLTADGASAGDILIDAEDDIQLTTTGKLTITNTEAATISGDLTVTGTLTAVGAYVNPFEIVAATNEIEITESGTVFILNHGTEFATTLPTVASSAGVTYRFIVGVDPAGTAFTILTDSLEDAIEGVVVVNGAAVGADGPDDTITFTASAAVVGDWVELTSDGVLWYLSGQAIAATGIVPTKAD